MRFKMKINIKIFRHKKINHGPFYSCLLRKKKKVILFISSFLTTVISQTFHLWSGGVVAWLPISSTYHVLFSIRRGFLQLMYQYCGYGLFYTGLNDKKFEKFFKNMFVQSTKFALHCLVRLTKILGSRSISRKSWDHQYW